MEWLKGTESMNEPMNNLPANHHFYKSFKNLLKGKLTAREVLIYGIIASFKNNPNGCFISRAEFAERINESEATAERAVQLLISEGYVKAYRQGRKRYLVLTDLYQVDTNEANRPADLYQVDTDESPNLYQNKDRSVSKHDLDLYQVDTLVRSITQIPSKIHYSDPASNTELLNKKAEKLGLKKRF